LLFEDEKEAVQFIMKGYHDFNQTMVEPNIARAFQWIEFEFDTKAEPYRLSFNEDKLSQSAGSASESYGRLTFPWISYRVSGTTPDLAGSTGWSKMICPKRMSLSLVRSRDMGDYSRLHRFVTQSCVIIVISEKCH
jgi:hypothetical protein